MVDDQPAKAGPRSLERHAIPFTVSEEAAEGLKRIFAMIAKRPPAVEPTSAEDFDRTAAQVDSFYGPLVRGVADSLGVTTIKDELGGVPVLRVRPAAWAPTGRTLVYLHGGGYVLFSAETSLTVPAQVAAATGHEVISVDYTLAPRGKWQSVTNEVLTVWRTLLANEVDPQSMALIGDSAGGSLAAGSILRMRDEELPLPGAAYLLSPWSDITATGDTFETLASADPTLNAQSLAWGAKAYADPEDQKHPYVSPVYGNYTLPYPPTLIQVGTREIFLSHAVRQYQAIRGGGHQAVLDVYEGMPHVHQALLPGAPETVTAIARAAQFFKVHLRTTAGPIRQSIENRAAGSQESQ